MEFSFAMFTVRKTLIDGVLGVGRYVLPRKFNFRRNLMTVPCFTKFGQTQRSISINMPISTRSVHSDQSMKPFLIVGLGNHDRLHTRHSVGMQVVDHVAERFKTSRWHKDVRNCAGYVSQGEIGSTGVKIILLKPRMPMNVNGTSVFKTARYFGVPPGNVFLIHDDIEKKLGKVIIKEGGSANGHNGVRSVINSLGADMMLRFKIGVDRPTSKSEVAEYVLSDFYASEKKTVTKVVDECVEKVIGKLEEQSGISMPDDNLDLNLSGGT